MNRMRYSEWKMMTRESSMGDRIKAKARRILQEHEAPSLPENICQEIDNILQKAEEREAGKAEAQKRT